MQKLLLQIFLLTVGTHMSVHAQPTAQVNHAYKNIELVKGDTLVYKVPLLKKGMYQFSILQQGVAVYYALTSPEGKKVRENTDIYDITGYEKFEYAPTASGDFLLSIARFEHPANPDSGQVTISIKRLSKQETSEKIRIQKELAPENAKNVTTIDIDHFWNAFDRLKDCEHYADSVDCFQKFYLDKATNGMLDFIQVRDWTAERFVDVVSKNRDFYESVRQSTHEAKKAVPVIEEVFKKFKALYKDFKPFKVCFAIGVKNTGGTVSDRYVLIGTEVTVSGSSNSEDIVQKIKGMVAHECVHTQQRLYPDTSAIQCPLLWQSLKEGSCNFIAELITGQSNANAYGEQHERQLWSDFKNELCNQNFSNWLYNGYAAKDKPGDLGYFIGYAIVRA